jgi:mono/diheme cytochrome c family protein
MSRCPHFLRLALLAFLVIPGTGDAQSANPLPADQPGDPMPPQGTQPEELVRRGRSLFAMNCAHCHGDDARGSGGPSLYDLTTTDGRIAQNIKSGIKGEMPAFLAKLNASAIQALISYLRTLKE